MEAAAGIYTRLISPEANIQAVFSGMQKTMLDATPDCIKVVSTDGRVLMMNKAGCEALGVPLDSDFGMPWLPLLPPEVHPLGEEALHKANEGHNARFPGKSILADGTRYWDNLLTPVIDASGRVLSILCVSRDITLKTELEKKLEEAIEREKLLSGEMHHRIKNLFSVVSGLISISEREAAADNSDSIAVILRDKLGALSRASDAVFAHGVAGNSDETTVDLGMVVQAVTQPYGNRCTIVGKPVSIPRAFITTFALLLHELATNSVKYGSLNTDNGSVTIQWGLDAQTLNLTWIENGGPLIASSPKPTGFGSKMVDRIVGSSGGTINRTWRAEGLVVDLHLPIG